MRKLWDGLRKVKANSKNQQYLMALLYRRKNSE